ncbi:MAG TPA: MFS transporter [Anaerohalosphaeraceae bacterium]|nr:MFS transporter [Anaerohalosphaeraceae bacterium]HPP55926.1 MFS transporter [Anaerohalosphaeraceae bacterium]
MDEPSGKLSFWEKIGYACGDFASVLFWQTISLHLLFFYTDVFGLSAAAAGTMIYLSRLWDGINDPLVGLIADRTSTRWGKFRPYLLWTAVPLAAAAVLTFTTPSWGPTAKLIYAYVTFNLFMMLYTVINIPYSAMLGVLTPDSSERVVLSSFKYFGAYGAGLVVSAFLMPMVKWIGGSGSSPFGWKITMFVFGAAAVVFFVITFLSTRERVSPPASQQTSIRQDIRDLLTNGPWLLLLFATLMMLLWVSIRLGVINYYFKYYIAPGKYEKWISFFNTVGMVGSLAGVAAVSGFARLLGKKKAFIVLFLIANVLTISFFIYTPNHLFLILAAQFVGSFAGGPLTPLIWAMYADAADYSEWKNGRRATGLVFSASTMAQKFAWAFGALLTGWLLHWFGYQPDTQQPERVIFGFRLLMSIIPGLAGLISIVIMFFYNLDEQTLRQIGLELQERRNRELSLVSEEN